MVKDWLELLSVSFKKFSIKYLKMIPTVIRVVGDKKV
jgi:hypothetical protein